MAGTDGDLGHNFNIDIDKVRLRLDELISSDSTSSSDRQNMLKQELRDMPDQVLKDMLEKEFKGMKEMIKDMVNTMMKEPIEEMRNSLTKIEEAMKDEKIQERIWVMKEEIQEQIGVMKDEKIQERIWVLKEEMKEMKDLYLSIGATELRTCAREIWRRIMQEPRVVIGDGMQFFDPDAQDLVESIAEVLGMEDRIPEVKEMSRIGITEGEAAMHYSTLKSLEDLVELCQKAMQMFPSLQQSHADEWFIVSHYWTLKELLPESFRD